MSNSITVLQAIKELSKVCDGAKVKDDNGFNAFDTSLKSYANYSSLTNEQQFKLKGKLEKYKTQLGVDEISIEVNENETQTIESQKAESTKEIKKSTRIVQGAIILYFDYSKNLVEAVKELPGRRFSATDKGWTIPISQSNLSEVKRFLDLYTFPYEEEKLSLNTSKNNQNRVQWDKRKGEVRLYFAYNPKIIDMFRDSIKWKTFNREDKYWSFNLTPNNARVLKLITDNFTFEYDEESLKRREEALERNKEEELKMGKNLEASKNYEAEIEVEGLKGTLRPFQKAGVKYIVENKRVIMGDEMGCISGEAIIQANRCGRSFKTTLKKLYEGFNNSWDKSKETKVRCLLEDRFGLNKVNKVVYSGVKETLLVKTESGKELRLTKDHEIKTPYGFIPLETLKVGDYVIVNGNICCPSCGTTENLIKYKYSKFKGYCKNCMYKVKRKNSFKYGIVKHRDGYVYASSIYFHPTPTKGYRKTMHTLSYEAAMNNLTVDEFIAELRNNPKSKELYKFIKEGYEVHHIDKNGSNNNLNNLKLVSRSEHSKEHRTEMHFGDFIGKGGNMVITKPKKDKIVYIGEQKEEDVYDIVMDDPYRNFIADGIVVHNCGKTIQAIASVHKLNTYPALIICPNTLKYNWESEYLKWTDKRISIQNTGDKFQFNGDVLIINYNTAVKYQEELEKCNFNSMVVDESQNIKNKKAKRSESIKQIQKSNNPELVLELTGTPIMNRPNELINQLELIDKLDAFGGFWEFAKRYCNAHRNRFGLDISGASNTEELHTKLRQLCYIRREKKDVLKELPDKQLSVIELDIDNRKEYNKAENDIINYLKENAKEDDKFLRSIKDLSKKEKEEARKKYREEKGKSAEAAEHLVQINTLKQLSAKGKLKESIEWINEIVDSGEKIVVFAVHKEIIKQVQEKFNCNKIDGSVSAEDRQKYVEDFQSNPNSKVIVLNMKAGSVGLTLTAASKLCFLELAWTPGEHKQAEDRIHRIGQKNTADIYYLLARNTIDIDIYSLIKEKERITNMVNAGINEEGNDISIMNELIGKLSGNKERKMERELKGFMEKHGINSYQMGSHELKR